MSGKLLLCLVVVFCAFQVISARPRLDGTFLENVKFELMRKCMGLENDIVKDNMNLKYKMAKEYLKLMNKAVKEESRECVESAKLQADEQLLEKSQEFQENIDELKGSLETGLAPESELKEIMTFRSDFKNKLNACKKARKLELKSIQNSFSAAGKNCLI